MGSSMLAGRRTQKHVRPVAVLAAAAAAAVFARATQEGPVALLPGEKASTVLAATGETRIAGLAVIAGSKLSVSARATGTSKVKPGLSLRNPAGDTIELGAKYRATGKTARISGYPVQATGIHRLSVSTPANFGGSVEVFASAAFAPKRTVAGTSSGGSGTVSFDALPGTKALTISAICLAKPSWTPALEIRDSLGALIGSAAGSQSVATARNVYLDTLGPCTVRVTGGDGAFRVTAKLKAPRLRRGLQWIDVVSPPDATSYTPTDADDDTLTRFDLAGAGYTTTDRVLFLQDGSTRMVADVTTATDHGAWFEADLENLLPGDYRLQAITKDGAKSDFPQVLHVANRAPAVGTTYPPFIPSGPGIPVVVLGAGFDATATFAVRTTSGQTPVTTTVTKRYGSARADLRLDPGAYVTGPCDVVVSETNGVVRSFTGIIDLVGWKQAPLDYVTYSATLAADSFYPNHAAFDPVTGNVCLAVKESAAIRYVLCDAVTGQLKDQVLIQSGTLGNPRVAFDPRDRVWALTWTRGLGSTTDAFVRIVPAASLSTTVQEILLDRTNIVVAVAAEPDPTRGGFLLVWDHLLSTTGPAEIRTRRITSSGTLAGSGPSVVASNSSFWAYDPTVTRLADDRCLIAYVGVNASLTSAAIWRVVTDSDGGVSLAPNLCTEDFGWYYTYKPIVCTNPTDGSVLLAFTYELASDHTLHPGTMRLVPGDFLPGTLVTVDDDGLIAQGAANSVVWNPARTEFVVSCTVPGYREILRRISPDGHIRVAPVSHDAEGYYGVLWSGPSADTMGFVRLSDGADDGVWNPQIPMRVRGGPIR